MGKKRYLNIIFPNNKKENILLQQFQIGFYKTSAYENT